MGALDLVIVTVGSLITYSAIQNGSSTESIVFGAGTIYFTRSLLRNIILGTYVSKRTKEYGVDQSTD